MKRLLTLHRYLGIAVGWLMLLWCLSGFVMLYVDYPSVNSDEALLVLPTLNLAECCRTPPIAAEYNWQSADIEMLGALPVLRARQPAGTYAIYDLSNGRQLDEIDRRTASRLVANLAGATPSAVMAYRHVLRDQWTVAGEFDAHRPLHRFDFADQAGTNWYLSAATGQLVQSTTAKERFWNQLGAVIHWLYPTALRKHALAWSQLVIWLSLAGTFLVSIGLYVGIRRVVDVSPVTYRRWHLVHHYAGLVFGLFALAWIVSGLLSMNPAGMLEGRSFSAEQRAIAGRMLSGAEIAAELPTLRVAPSNEFVRISASLFGGEFAWIGWRRNGATQRLSGPPDVDVERLERHLPNIRPGADIKEAGMLENEDTYFYGDERRRQLPVYRVSYADGERLYLDRTSGELLLGVDAGRRGYRWFFNALHSGDFAAWSRDGPLRNFFMIVLLAGVTLGSATGVYLAYRRIVD